MVIDASITYWLSGVGPCIWIRQAWDRAGQWYTTTGTLTGLMFGYLEGETPVGVVLDRMQECPEEVQGLEVEAVSEVVALLRERHPDGI